MSDDATELARAALGNIPALSHLSPDSVSIERLGGLV